LSKNQAFIHKSFKKNKNDTKSEIFGQKFPFHATRYNHHHQKLCSSINSISGLCSGCSVCIVCIVCISIVSISFSISFFLRLDLAQAQHCHHHNCEFLVPNDIFYIPIRLMKLQHHLLHT